MFYFPFQLPQLFPSLFQSLTYPKLCLQNSKVKCLSTNSYLSEGLPRKLGGESTQTLEVIMNFAVKINGITFPFVKYSAAEKAVLQFKGATLHRILGKRGTQFILGGEL